MMTKESYLEWKDHLGTQEFKKAVQEGIEGLVASLISKRESNPTEDMYMRGWIRGMVEVLEWEPELINGEEN